MACTACTKRYGLFCKEVGCPNCGYSFCSKCLKKLIEVPRRGGAKMAVCLKCYEKLDKIKTSMGLEGNPVNIGDVLKLDNPLEDVLPPLQPIHTAEEAKPDEIEDNLDSVINSRLKDLKGKDGASISSDKDMAMRLAELKGQPFKEYSKSNLLAKDTRTDQEKMDDLLKQFLEEKSIDESVPDPVADIENRLANLKGNNAYGASNAKKHTEGISEENDEDEEAAAANIIEKFVAESKLPDAMLSEEEKEFIKSIPQPSGDNEELPWCTICNEDASVRCLGCDGELFCKTCFAECHEDEDFKQHPTKPFSMPPNFKEDHF